MSYRNIALMGKARSGKDEVGKYLTANFAFTRVAFADPLKGMALSLDPIIGAESGHYGYLPNRLSDIVRRYGWEKAKDRYPEIRRTLQRLGQTVRVNDADYWVNIAMDKVDVADTWNLPVVVTDVRYPNEADALRARGFLLARVQRPAAEHLTLTQAGAATHESETALDDYPADVTLANVGTLPQLHLDASQLVTRR
ncbi:hypothetical protein ACFYZ4_15115 [Streptomyces sp. NPDC001513]|uniref:deoxynucleotide monophosphate kinase family protein n=1 Tax=Streptomyces sp. NPDC001513 TaxID=3364580 RepID=UPI0036A348B4